MAILIQKLEQKLGFGCLLLFIFSFSIFVVINSPWLYDLSIRGCHLVAITHLSSHSLLKCYFVMIRYLQIPWDSTLQLPDFKSSPQGLVHFRDVRHLVLINNMCLLISGLGGFKYFNFLWRFKLQWTLVWPLKITLAWLLVIFSMILVNFQAAFVIFHRLLFRNRDWLFTSRADPVILALPSDYFLTTLVMFLLISLSLLFLTLVWARSRN